MDVISQTGVEDSRQCVGRGWGKRKKKKKKKKKKGGGGGEVSEGGRRAKGE